MVSLYVVLEYLYSIPNTITYLNNIRHKSDSDSVFAQYDVLVHLETFDIAHKTPIAYQNQRIFKNSAAQMRIGLDASTEIITWGIGKYINSLKVSSKLSTVDDTVELFRYIDDTTSSINKGTSSTAQQLEEIANKANQTVPGQGTVPGTLKHSEFAKQVKGLNNPLLQAEVTYKNGQLVPYGTKGGVRLDVVEYNVDGTIKAVYDLKTGKAGLTTSRIQEILNHLPNNAPVYEIRPK